MTPQHPYRFLAPVVADWTSAHLLNMLYRDYRLQFVPYPEGYSPYELTVDWSSAQVVANSLTLRNRHRGVADFIRDVGEILLFRHEVWLYLMFGQEHKGQGPFLVFEITGVERKPNGTFVQTPLQSDNIPNHLPWQDSWNHETELDVSRLVHVTLPDAYPSKILSQLVSNLSSMDFIGQPAWVMEHAAGQGGDNVCFDVREADRIKHLRYLQVARAIGWTAREENLAPNTYTSVYYRGLRNFRFMHFLASMRECAERAMCKILTVAGGRCGFAASVASRGVYTTREIEKLRKIFVNGRMEFSEVSKIRFGRSEMYRPDVRNLS